MKPFQKRVVRALSPVAVLAAIALPLRGEDEAVVPRSERPESMLETDGLAGSDDCGCARELTSCLLAATRALNQCLSTARGAVGEAICLGMYEVRVGLCYQEVAKCVARCVV